MELLRTLETKLAEQFDKLPHLPQNARRWIAVNAWWIVMVIAIVTSLALLFSIPAIFALAGLSAYSSIYAYSTVPVNLLVTSATISLFFSAISLVLLWVAVSPLKEVRRRGWKLLFLNEIVSVLSAVVSFLVLIQNFNLWGLIWALIVIAVELYVLFEVRGEFGSPVKKTRARSREAKAVEAEVVTPKRQSKKK